ncbi:ribonuclease R [Myxococcus stipitatus]|uniref:ribonuclease R n=1 Tax=Myxococcus stipitatus TaxID=83455 RepID=UPI001F1BF276|nr:ribonuclease R [Myxococcus stipitatus]MCE9670422.1 ribonuclease R [Myxococcus stipitatus]
MSISPDLLQQILVDADHPLGIKELLRLAGLHPGQQTDLKRTLRELVRQGSIIKEGKRFLRARPRREDVAGPRPGRPAHEGERLERPRQPGGGPRGGPAREHGFERGPARPERRGPRGGPAREHGFERGASRPERHGFRGQEARPTRDFRHDGRRHSGRNRFFDESSAETVEGILHVHRDGFGFVHPVSGEGENIFLPPGEAQRALDNDRVVVAVAGRPGRYEGRLLRVVDRRRELAVGVYAEQGRYALVVPTDTSLPGPIRVPFTQMAQDGDLVKVRLGVGSKLLDPGRDLYGEVAGSLGKPGTPSAEVLGIAFSQGFSDEFPPEVMDEADRYAVTVTEEEARGEERRDLRAMQLVTIDGEDARDFDDAVYVEDHADGWRLVVAIADVTHYVRERSALDAEALRRATSVYLPDRVLPMLPERLSNGICSLRPDEDRLCMVADMTFDRQGQRRSYTLYPAVMRSAARCTYNEVQDVLDGKDVPHRNAFKAHFERLMALARALMKMRKERGAIDFDLPEHKVVLGKDGLPQRMDKRERKDSHRLIEECMLAANEAVARFFQDEGLPTVYRFHGEPDPEKLATFAALAEAYGFKLRFEDGVSSKELDAFISQLSGHPEQRALNQLLLRSMMQAVYTSTQVGHYGLAAEYYLHFTSPIRRYPDLLVHRLLKAHWARKGRKPTQAMLEREEEALEDMAVQCSDRERAAMQVEREVVSFYAALMMKDRVGEEFAATVAAITDFGFFVELDVEHVEGLVKAETLGPGSKLDKQTHSLVYPNGRRVRVGQKLRVRLTSVNATARKIDFEALQFEGEAPLARAEGAQRGRRHEWREQAVPHGRQRAGRPGKWEREQRRAEQPEARRSPDAGAHGQPRGRFVRDGRREESAPTRVENASRRSWKEEASASREPQRSSSAQAHGSKPRKFFRPEPPRSEAVVGEVVPETPRPATTVGPRGGDEQAPWVAPTAHGVEEGASSPHPGFDRLRALAAQGKPHHGRKEGKGAQQRHGGKDARQTQRPAPPSARFVPPTPREDAPDFEGRVPWQPSIPSEPPRNAPAVEAPLLGSTSPRTSAPPSEAVPSTEKATVDVRPGGESPPERAVVQGGVASREEPSTGVLGGESASRATTRKKRGMKAAAPTKGAKASATGARSSTKKGAAKKAPARKASKPKAKPGKARAAPSKPAKVKAAAKVAKAKASTAVVSKPKSTKKVAGAPSKKGTKAGAKTRGKGAKR